jgi:hypothetical protein
MTEPTEAKPEQKQTATKDAVRVMLKALELAENADSYKESEKGHINILVNNGKDKTNDPTLAAYIKKAEQAFIQKHAFAIIKDAKELLENEIGEIREMLG